MACPVIDTMANASWFSDVVIATHANEALQVLADADAAERASCGAFHYTEKPRGAAPRCTLDAEARRRVWSSWNYIAAQTQAANARSASPTG